MRSAGVGYWRHVKWRRKLFEILRQFACAMAKQLARRTSLLFRQALTPRGFRPADQFRG
jgi:hypothetical protein